MENSLYIVSWNVTRKCNLLCAHCYLPAREGGGDTGTDLSRELSAPEALRVVDQIARVNPEAMLILSGGEPLLRKDIFELAEYASRKGMMVVLGSNGLLIDDGVASKLKQAGVSGVSIGLDSIDPKVHDGIRSLEGSWEGATRAVRICQDNGLAVQINTTVTENNYGEIPGLARYSQTLGAKVFSPFFLICTGRGERLADIPLEKQESILSSIVDLQNESGGVMVRTRCAPTFRRILYQRNPGSPLLKMDSGRCLAGLHYCRITPEGEVTPCPYMPLSLGNLRTTDFEEIWMGSEVLASLRRPSLKGKCKGCEFRRICGGCRARAFASYKDYLAEDPWCAYTPEGREVIAPPGFCSDTRESGPLAMGNPLWTAEAEERLKRVPFFVRAMVRSAVERYALKNRCHEITPRTMEQARDKLGPKGMAGHFQLKGKNEYLSLGQDGQRPVNEGGDEQSDSGFAMNGHANPDPAQPCADLEKQQEEIHNPQD